MSWPTRIKNKKAVADTGNDAANGAQSLTRAIGQMAQTIPVRQSFQTVYQFDDGIRFVSLVGDNSDQWTGLARRHL